MLVNLPRCSGWPTDRQLGKAGPANCTNGGFAKKKKKGNIWRPDLMNPVVLAAHTTDVSQGHTKNIGGEVFVRMRSYLST